jgi:cell division protein FtsI/penicillin-binding protein 2
MVVASSQRRRSLARRRLIFLGAVVVVVGLVVVAIVMTGGRPEAEVRAQRFVSAWARGDYAAMHAELGDDARKARSVADFTADYRAAAATATATAFRPGKVGKLENGIVSVPMTVTTRVFGTVQTTLRLPFTSTDDNARIAWARNLTFPGVERGERLERSTQLPRRASLLFHDGTPLAEGDQRTSPLGPVASAIAGQLAAVPAARVDELRAKGVPPDATVGTTGLERVFDDELRGRPGGTLRAGTRVLGTGIPRPAQSVRTTIDPALQRAAVDALGARFGGVAVLRPKTGEILGLAGAAFSGLQPPGSTFKMITLSGALEARLAGPNSSYPVETAATLEGVQIENANGESCGGSLRLSFAHSCNSVFAPLGARLGPERLVAIAEKFGFNQDVGIPGAATSTIPKANVIGDPLAVGSSAIGQGKVQATALQMAWVAATIGEGGNRVRLTLRAGQPAPAHKPVLRPATARIVREYMEAVVNVGTGAAAAIPGVRVAGKTGTAELKNTSTPDCTPTPEAPDCPPVVPNDPTDTDAWFAAFAPAKDPRIAIGVLLIANGAGGDTAAPVAREVLLAGLQHSG